MRRRIHLVLGLLLIVSLVLVGCGKNPGGGGKPGASPPGQVNKSQRADSSHGGQELQKETTALGGPGDNNRGPAGLDGRETGVGQAGRDEGNTSNTELAVSGNSDRREPEPTGEVTIAGIGDDSPGGSGKLNRPAGIASTEKVNPMAAAASQQPGASLPIQMPVQSAEAQEAIVSFANDQLGTMVTLLYAGEATQEVLSSLSTLPAELQEPVQAAQDMSATGYYGLLDGGVAALAIGDCSEEASCQLSGDMPVDLSQATLGVYALQTSEIMPSTTDDALQLVAAVYPKLAGLEFVQVADAPDFTFSATTTSAAVENGQPTLVVKVVLAGVMDMQGHTLVYAAVGLGETYASLLNPF